MRHPEISINATARAVYIKVKEGKVARTKEIAQEVFVDLDSSGRLLGIELLNPGNIVIGELSRRYHLPLLRNIAPEIDRIYRKLQAA